MTLLSYTEVLEHIGSKSSHLLVGNGVSIACDGIFKYENLFQRAKGHGLSERAAKVFERMGTNNFEAVMRLLSDGHWLGQTYDFIKGETSLLLDDLDTLKKALVESIAKTHLRDTSCVSDAKKTAAASFLKKYDNIFTTNYDLLMYWVNMSTTPPPYGDGFRSEWEDQDAKTVVFAERLGKSSGIFYLHGALQLFVERGEVRKHCWRRSHRPLTDLIKDGLKAGQYPLFVAEGTAEKKLEQINRSGYLSYCLGKLHRVENSLVAIGFGFGESDSHIADAIADGKFSHLYVGLHGDHMSPTNQSIIARVELLQKRRNDRALAVAAKAHSTIRKGGKPAKVKALVVKYFTSSTAKVWG